MVNPNSAAEIGRYLFMQPILDWNTNGDFWASIEKNDAVVHMWPMWKQKHLHRTFKNENQRHDTD